MHPPLPRLTNPFGREMLGYRENTEEVDVLDGIGLLQRSPVGWHLYQHLIRKAGIGLLLKLESADPFTASAAGNGAAGPLRFVVAALMDGGPARLTGEIGIVSAALSFHTHRRLSIRPSIHPSVI